MCCEREILTEELNPTFLFTWKGTRTCDEKNYHCHENHIEMNFILSGRGKYRIDDEIYQAEAVPYCIQYGGREFIPEAGKIFYVAFLFGTDAPFVNQGADGAGAAKKGVRI